MRTTLLLDHCPHEPAGWTIRGLLRIEGIAPPNDARVPLNLSLVLDRSGSMAGAKLAAARDAAAHLVKRLGPDDRISVVAYDDEVTTPVPTTTAGQGADILHALRAIHSGGSTNLSGGWLRGRELVAEGAQPNAVNRVILLTDGLANMGIRDSRQLAALAATAHEHGISTTTIGFGEDYDENLLRGMAEAGGGQMYYIERPDQAPAVFEHEIRGLLGVCAQNVTVQFLSPDTLVAVRHDYSAVNGMPNTFLLGDLYAAQPLPLLFEIFLDHAPGLIELQIAEIVVRGTVIENGQVEARTITLPIKIDLSRGAFTEPAIERETLLLESARVREAALAARERGDWDAARGSLRQMSAKLRAYGLADADVAEEALDMDGLASLLELSAADVKYMYQRSHDTRRGTYSKKDLIARSQRRKPPEA